MYTFSATIQLLGINPFVLVPDELLNAIFKQAQKDKGSIPIKGTINGQAYKQTLVKYAGAWRLYINTKMLKNSPKRIGETILVMVAFDAEERIIEPHPDFVLALNKNANAKAVFEGLTPSLQKEIIRYLSFLKQEKSIADNIEKAIGFLEGKNRFVGRDPLKIK